MEKLTIQKLPINLIAFIYQYLEIEEIDKSSKTCKQLQKAFNVDFLWSTLIKKFGIFLPFEEEKFPSWKKYYSFLKNYPKNISDGRPKSFKMIPFRGHSSPITAIETFSNKRNLSYTLVSGDQDGTLLTWNLDEDGDKEKDVIKKLSSKIIGIESLKNDSNMIVWTITNTFYYFEVDMIKQTEENSSRFKLISEFNIPNEVNSIHQVFLEENTSVLYMSPNFNGPYNGNSLYSYDLKDNCLKQFSFSYKQSEILFLENSVYNNSFLENSIFYMKDSKKFQTNNFVITENRIITYINYDPIKKHLLNDYTNRTDGKRQRLPNVFSFNKSNALFDSFRFNLDYIYNILPLNQNEIGFIGARKGNNNNYFQVYLQIYSENLLYPLREICLYDNAFSDFRCFDLASFNKDSLVYIINENDLRKIENLNVKQLTVKKVGNLKEVNNINCFKCDQYRIVSASDNMILSISNGETGEFWFNLLGGSLSVKPKSFVDHPVYKGFHIVKITRTSIFGVIGNLIRQYNFIFKEN